MKDDIHPKYHPKATITCACGVAFVVGSTAPAVHVELCSACHPFYTGKQKMMDTARRVDRFQRRAELTTTTAASRVGRRVKKERNVARRKAKSEALGAEK
jgi:large subunit ribosomal protein L31